MLPRNLLLPAFLALGRLAHRVNTPRTRVLRETLALIDGELGTQPGEDLVLAACESRSRYWYEYLELPSMTVEQVLARTTIDGLHHLAPAYEAGAGVVIASLHSRNWDFPMVALAAELGTTIDVPCGLFVEHPVLDWVMADRRRHNLRYVPPATGRGTRFAELADRVGKGGVAVVVTDFAEGGGGCEVELLGRPAIISTGAAALAMDTGAPLLTLVNWYDTDGRVRAAIGPSIVPPDSDASTREISQRIADTFSDAIRRHPADWHSALGAPDRSGKQRSSFDLP